MAATDPKKVSMKSLLPFWQRLLITVGVMLLTSYLAGLLCQIALGLPIPSYIAGLVGGLAALPTWDFLKRIRPSRDEQD